MMAKMDIIDGREEEKPILWINMVSSACHGNSVMPHHYFNDLFDVGLLSGKQYKENDLETEELCHLSRFVFPLISENVNIYIRKSQSGRQSLYQEN